MACLKECPCRLDTHVTQQSHAYEQLRDLFTL